MAPPLELTRRRFLLSVASLAPLQFLDSRLAFAQADQGAEAEVSIESWMDGWMETRGLAGTLKLSRFVEPIYFLTDPISWFPQVGSKFNYSTVTAPKGFVTDLASIPRPFFSLLRPDGEYAYAAILHDFLYWTQSRPRDEADNIFKLAMEELEVTPTVVATIYRAVRMGGARAWSSNAKLIEKGEKRILRVFPDEPTIRWRDWKQRGDVFE